MRPEEGAGHDLRIASYGLNDQLVANYAALGITALHACQRKSRATGEDAEVLLERFLAQWFDGAPIETAEELGL